MPFECDEDCQKAFGSVKAYLTKPPFLASPVKGKPVVLYITTFEHCLDSLLAKENAEGKKNALYYLNRTLVGPEVR